MITRADDTIVLPQRSTRADGINPDIPPECNCCERAVFHFHDQVNTGQFSLPWIADHDSLLVKFTVAATYIPENFDPGYGDEPATAVIYIEDNEAFSLVLEGQRTGTYPPQLPVHQDVNSVRIQMTGNLSAYSDMSAFLSMQCTELGGG